MTPPAATPRRQKVRHIVHLSGGLDALTRCGAEGIVHIVGPAKIHQVTCAACREWYYDMRLRLSAIAFMRRTAPPRRGRKAKV